MAKLLRLSSSKLPPPFLHLKFGSGRPPQFGHQVKFSHQFALSPITAQTAFELPEGLATEVQREGIARYLANNYKEGSEVHRVLHERVGDEGTYVLVCANWHRSQGDPKLHLSLYIYSQDRHDGTWHAYTDRTVSFVSSVPLEPVAYSTPASIVNTAPAFAPRPSRIAEEAQRKRLDLPAAAPASDDDEAFRPPESREERPSEPAFEVPAAEEDDEETSPPIVPAHPARRSTPAPTPPSVAPPPSSLPPKVDPPAATPTDPSWDLPPPEEDEPLVDEDWMKPPVEEEGFEEFFDRGRAAETRGDVTEGKLERPRSRSRAREVPATEDRGGRPGRPHEERSTTPLPSTRTRVQSRTRSDEDSDKSDTRSLSPPPPTRTKTPSSPPVHKTRDGALSVKLPILNGPTSIPPVSLGPLSADHANRTSKPAPTSSSVPLTISPTSSSDEDDDPPLPTRHIIPSAPLALPSAPLATKEDLDPRSSDPPFNPSDIHLPRPVPQRQSTIVAEKAKEVLGGWWKGVSEFVVAQTDVLATGEQEESEEEDDSSEEERRRRKEKRRKKKERRERERKEQEASDIEREKTRLDVNPAIPTPPISSHQPPSTPIDVNPVPINPQRSRATKSQADPPISLLPPTTAAPAEKSVSSRPPIRERAKSISASLDAGFRDLTATVAKAVASRVEAYSVVSAVEVGKPEDTTRSKEDRGSRRDRKEHPEIGRVEETEGSTRSRSHRSRHEDRDVGGGTGDSRRRAAREPEEADLIQTAKPARILSIDPPREDRLDPRHLAPVAARVPTPQPSSAYPRSIRDELKRMTDKADVPARVKTTSSRSGWDEASKSSRRNRSRSTSPPRIKSSHQHSSRSHRSRDDGSRRPEEMDGESRSRFDVGPPPSSRAGRQSKATSLASTAILPSSSYLEPSSSDSEPSTHRYGRSSRKAKPDRTESPARIDRTSPPVISSTRSAHQGSRTRSGDDDIALLRPSSPPTSPAPNAPSFAHRTSADTHIDHSGSRRSRTSTVTPIEPGRAGQDEDGRRSSRHQDSNSLSFRAEEDEGRRTSRREREGRSSRHGQSGDIEVTRDRSQRREDRRTRYDEEAIEAEERARTAASGGRRMVKRAGTGRY